jgi:hypothetical protein
LTPRERDLIIERTFIDIGMETRLRFTKIHGVPPAESDFQRFFRVTPPVVHQMIKTLHAQGFIDREPDLGIGDGRPHDRRRQFAFECR